MGEDTEFQGATEFLSHSVCLRQAAGEADVVVLLTRKEGERDQMTSLAGAQQQYESLAVCFPYVSIDEAY